VDDCASRHDFHVGDDFTVGCHDGSVVGPCPVAGLSLLMFLALHDASVQSGESTLTIPSLEN
jgi:hypothetical protein